MTKKNEESFDPLAGYNPMKPLLIEPPIGYLERDALELDKTESTFNNTYFNPAFPLEDKDYKIILRTSMTEKKLKTLDCVPAYISGQIINQNVLDIFHQYCSGDFQAIPVIIKSKSRNIDKQFVNLDYYFVHITRKIQTLDFQNSEFLLINKESGYSLENSLGPKKIRFKTNCMEGAYIGRDYDYPLFIKVISQDFFQILQERKLTGVAFLPDWLSMYERGNGSFHS